MIPQAFPHFGQQSPFSSRIITSTSTLAIITAVGDMLISVSQAGSLPTPTRFVSKAGTSSDLNNGETEVTAWLTIGKVNSELSGLSGDDVIGFRAGDIFDDTTLIIARPGISAVAPLQFVKFGTGDNPIIRGGIDLVGWTFDSGLRWFHSYSGATPSHLVRNGINSFPDQEVNAAAVTADNQWFYDTVADRIYFASTTNPNLATMEAGVDTPVAINTGASFIRLRNIHAKVSNGNCIDITGGINVELWDCEVENANFSGLALRGNAHSITVERGRYHHCGKFRGIGTGTGNVGHGVSCNNLSNAGPLIVDSAELDNNSEDGVQWNNNPGQDAGQGHIVRFCNIHDNIENGVDNKAAHNVLIHDCIVLDHAGEGLDAIGHAGLTKWHRNIVGRSGTTGLLIGSSAGQALAEGDYDHEIIDNVVFATGQRIATFGPLVQLAKPGTGNIKVWNNVCSADAPGGEGLWLRDLTDGGSVDARNNIFDCNGVALLLQNGTPFSALAIDQNNLFRRNGGATNPAISRDFVESYTHAQITSGAYTAATGKGQNTITGDPGFKDEPNDDYRITIGAITEDAGQTIAGVVTDLLGDTWGSPPHMGAYATAVAA